MSPHIAITAFFLGAPFMIGIDYSVPLLYLPLELQKFGVEEYNIGLIFCTYSLTIVVVAEYFATRIDVIGRKQMIAIGYLFMTGPFAMFGLASYFQLAKVTYILVSMAGRMMHGVGTLMLACTSYSTLVISYPKNRNVIISIAETALNIG